MLSLFHIILLSPHFIGVCFCRRFHPIQHSFGPWRKHRFLFRKSLWAVILGSWGRLWKIPRGFFSIQKIQQTIENQKQRAAAQASLLRKHDISIKNIPSMCVTVAPGLQSPVAVLVPKRLGSWFRQLRSTSAKKWRWNHRKHIREVRQTATYRTNRCIIFYITYYIIQMYTVYTYTLVDRHVLPDTQDIRHHPTEVTLPAAEPKQPRYVVFAGIPKS